MICNYLFCDYKKRDLVALVPLPYEKLFPLTKGRLAEIVYFKVSSLTPSLSFDSCSRFHWLCDVGHRQRLHGC